MINIIDSSNSFVGKFFKCIRYFGFLEGLSIYISYLIHTSDISNHYRVLRRNYKCYRFSLTIFNNNVLLSLIYIIGKGLSLFCITVVIVSFCLYYRDTHELVLKCLMRPIMRIVLHVFDIRKRELI